jgi:hypothetical protein
MHREPAHAVVPAPHAEVKQRPAVHTSVAAQLVPQLPQLRRSFWKSAHPRHAPAPPHARYPGAHAGAPALHISRWQTARPHAPQLAASSRESMQAVPQVTIPGSEESQTHAPAMQTRFAPHGAPQPVAPSLESEAPSETVTSLAASTVEESRGSSATSAPASALASAAFALDASPPEQADESASVTTSGTQPTARKNHLGLSFIDAC